MEWEPRDKLLKSCFCKEGHLRIPESNGCYDPIRRVVTLKDACFADYHCNDLPNTACIFDEMVPKFNKSCQCLKGNKPFDANTRTGLIEGCAPLTDQDKATVLGIFKIWNETDFNLTSIMNFQAVLQGIQLILGLNGYQGLYKGLNMIQLLEWM